MWHNIWDKKLIKFNFCSQPVSVIGGDNIWFRDQSDVKALGYKKEHFR